jgi:hypothetical protein
VDLPESRADRGALRSLLGSDLGNGSDLGFRDRVAAILRAHQRLPKVRYWAIASVAAAEIAWVVPCRAEEPASPTDCPSHDAVAKAVRGLLNRSHIEIANIESAFDVRDLGQRYIVTVRERTREYDDESRDCVRRARVAAVFVALTLAPPDIGLPDLAEESPQNPTPTPEPAPSSPPPPSPPKPTPPQPLIRIKPAAIPSSWRAGVEIGALCALAPSADQTLTAFGAELRFFLTESRLGFHLGASLATADSLDLASSSVRLQRFPFDVGLRWNWSRAWLGGSLDLGAVMEVLTAQQTNLPQASQKTLVEVGGRAGITLLASRSTVAPFIRGFAELYPSTHALAVEPRGVIGRTPAWWAGTSVGLAGFFN